MSFLFAHNDEGEIDRARSVLSTFGAWYGCVQTRLPALYDLHHTEAAVAAAWNAKLASVEFRNMVSGPVVTVETALRIPAFGNLPGAAFPLVFRMFTPSELVAALDARHMLDRECAYEIGLAYVDLRSLSNAELVNADPDRWYKTFTHRIDGHIIDEESLRSYGEVSSMLDIFIPCGENAPFSRLLPSRREHYAKYFESVYMDFVQWYHERFLQPAPEHDSHHEEPLVLVEEHEDSRLDDTLVIDRALLNLGPMPPEFDDRSVSRKTMIGIPSVDGD